MVSKKRNTVHQTRRYGRAESLEARRLLSGDPIISEFQAINRSTLIDEDGDTSDWLEIRNLRDEPLDLTGWYLTDDQADLRKWEFPDTTIPADDHLLVFASNKDRDTPGQPLHTNFRLSGRGEYLGLISADGITVIDDFGAEYPPQTPDQSYGKALGRDTTTFLDRDAAVLTHVPVNDDLGAHWQTVNFDDAGWQSGRAAVGFERLTPASTFRDDFDDGLGDDWTIDIPAEGTSQVSVDNGQLLISAPDRQINGNDDRRGLAPYVYRELPATAENYDITTRIHTPTSGSVGIVVYDASTERPALVVEYQRRTNFRMTDVTGRRIDSVRKNGQDSSFLRLHRNGVDGTWSAYFKIDEAEDWTFIASIEDSNPEMGVISAPLVGLQVNTSSTAVDARFDYFEIEFAEQNPVYTSRIGLDVQSQMADVNSSIYLRFPFQIEGDAQRFNEMTLAAAFDDGFRAYVNGEPVAAENVPIESAWNSSASTQFGAIGSEIPRRVLNLDSSTDFLQTGENVLAIHGMNLAAEDADFFFEPIFTGSEPVELAEQFFQTPTPGTANLRRMATEPRIIGKQGIFVDNTMIELVVDNAPPTIAIHYTLDGTEPTTESPMYQGPFSLTRSAMLQARAFDLSANPQLEPSAIVSATFVGVSAELANRSSSTPIILMDTMTLDVPGTNSTSFVATNTVVLDTTNSSGRAEITGNVEYLGRAGIRQRGSTSGGQAKPNLAFEFWGPDGTHRDDDFDASLAGLPQESDWVLHAPFQFDLALIRNQMFFALARSVLPWAPRTRAAEVYLNTKGETISDDDYVGTYAVIEKIKRGPDRIAISGIDPTDSDPSQDSITGGYIWKIDRGDPGEPGFSGGGRGVNWVYPKSPGGTASEDQKATPAQQQWASEYLDEFASTLQTPNLHDPEGYSKYIDVDSWIDNHLVNVLTFNVDALRLSAYFFKDRNSKLEYGPPWDCDRCMESTDSRDDQPDEWYDPGGTDFFTDDTYSDIWFQKLFKDSHFWQAYIDRWHELRQTIWSNAGLDRFIDELAEEVAESQPRNLERWRLHPRESSAYNSGQLDGTWRGEIEHMRHWFHARADFMDHNFVGTPRLIIDGKVLGHVEGAQISPGTLLEIGGPPMEVLDDTPIVSSGEGGSTSTYMVPQNDSMGTSWTELDFDDSKWETGTNGFGFDDRGNFDDHFVTRVKPRETASRATTLLTRTDFQVPDLNAFQDESLVLRLKYDDGFVAYLNGKRVAHRNLASKPTEPQSWNSRARPRLNASAILFEDFDLTEYKHLLVEGTNVLALRGLNSSAANLDMLLTPELVRRVSRIESNNQGTTYYTLDGTDPRGTDGQPTPSAIVARPGQPLAIEDNVRIIARTFDETDRGPESQIVLSDWGAPAVHDIVVEPLPLVISEFSYRPAISDSDRLAGYASSDFEFVELYNRGTTPVNLVGAKLSGAVDFDLFESTQTQLGPGVAGVVVADHDAFRFRYGDDVTVLGEFAGRLNNAGETLELLDGTEQVTFSVVYQNNDLWPEAANGVGATLQLQNANSLTDGKTYHGDWRSSQRVGGSPGSISDRYETIVINEVLANPNTEQNQDAIEIHNPSDAPIDISGWYVSDDDEDLLKFQIPTPTVVSAGGYVVLHETEFNPPGPQGFGLSADEGDDVWLTIADANQNLITVVDEVHFGATPDGESVARYPNGTGYFTPAIPSLAASNTKPRVGPLIINELQYHAMTSPITPVDMDDLEYVDIKNPTSAPVSMRNWQLDGGIRYQFPSDFELGADSTVTVLAFNPSRPDNSSRLAAFRSFYDLDDQTILVGGYQGQLNNREDVVRLLRPGTPVDDQPNAIPLLVEDIAVYADQSPWPIGPDGFGEVLHRQDSAIPAYLPDSWRAGVPTPGHDNPLEVGGFDGNQQLDANDIDLLFAATRADSANTEFDLNSDGVVDEEDRDYMITQVMGTTYGDANLDGVFDHLDLVALFTAATYEDDIPLNGTWAHGDFDGDGDFTSEDIVYAFQRGSYRYL